MSEREVSEAVAVERTVKVKQLDTGASETKL